MVDEKKNIFEKRIKGNDDFMSPTTIHRIDITFYILLFYFFYSICRIQL